MGWQPGDLFRCFDRSVGDRCFVKSSAELTADRRRRRLVSCSWSCSCHPHDREFGSRPHGSREPRRWAAPPEPQHGEQAVWRPRPRWRRKACHRNARCGGLAAGWTRGQSAPTAHPTTPSLRLSAELRSSDRSACACIACVGRPGATSPPSHRDPRCDCCDPFFPSFFTTVASPGWTPSSCGP